jgi:hypothetical protein
VDYGRVNTVAIHRLSWENVTTCGRDMLRLAGSLHSGAIRGYDLICMLGQQWASQPAGRGKRLVTLTGVGGAGKSRLAIEVAHSVMDVSRTVCSWSSSPCLPTGAPWLTPWPVSWVSRSTATGRSSKS